MQFNRRNIIIIAAALLGGAALVMLSIFIYRTVINPGAAFTLPEPQPTQQQADAGGQTAHETVQPDMGFMKGRVNILVMGMDSNEQRLGTKREDFRTDTMLLVTIDFNTGKVDMITTPRDSYVHVTNASGELYKVNAAAYFGGGLSDSGFANACDTISGVYGGIPVPYYIGVNMDGLVALVDAMGGVDYDVDIEFQGTNGMIYEGYQHLDSQQALDYLRVRKGYGTDVDRQERQRRLLIAVFSQLADSGQIKNLPQIYQSLKDMIYTNLTLEQICALAVFGAGFDDWADIGQYTLPGEYHTAYGVYFYLLDQQGKADIVKQVFGINIGIDEEHDINYVLSHSGNDKPRKTQTPKPEATPAAPPDTDEPPPSPEPTEAPAEPTEAPSPPEPAGEE